METDVRCTDAHTPGHTNDASTPPATAPPARTTELIAQSALQTRRRHTTSQYDDAAGDGASRAGVEETRAQRGEHGSVKTSAVKPARAQRVPRAIRAGALSCV